MKRKMKRRARKKDIDSGIELKLKKLNERPNDREKRDSV